jgi:ADP-heptose:LPS heptosyltransferase
MMADSQNRKDVSRDRMMGEIAEGVGEGELIDFSGKSILARGCDPQMAIRASKMLPPHLGNPEFVSCTDDDDFLAKLRERKWSVIFFAPGACRYSAAMMPIPGARSHTRGWSLDQYRNLARKYQGEEIHIVETTEEREIIPRLRSALSKAK